MASSLVGAPVIAKTGAKSCQRAEQLVEVHASGAQAGIHLVSNCPGKPVAIHAVLSLQVTSARFDGGSLFHPPPRAFGRTSAPSFVHVNLDVASVVMTPIAHVYENLLWLTGYPLHLSQRLTRGVAVMRIAMERFCAYEPTTAAGSCNTHLAAEFVALVDLAFAAAFRGVHAPFSYHAVVAESAWLGAAGQLVL